MATYPATRPLSRREVLSRVARGEVYRYSDPISKWSAPGRRGYRVMVTAQMRALIADGLAVEGETRGMAVYAALTDAGRAVLDTPHPGRPLMTKLWTESAMRVRMRDSRTIHATRLSAERRVWTACGRIVSTSAGDEIMRGEPDATCPRCGSALALAAERFWPPQVGDVWLGNLGERIPQPLVCGAHGNLYVGGDGIAPDRAYDSFGPLKLVWRGGAVVTAMHASELPA